MIGRRGRRRKWLRDDLKERKGKRKLKEKALDRTICGRGYGNLVRQAMGRMNVF